MRASIFRQPAEKARGVESRPRLAVVQHGDYREALGMFRAEQPETYSGMKYSVDVLEQLLGKHRFVMVSLGANEDYQEPHRNGTLIGMREPTVNGAILKRLEWRRFRRRVVAGVKQFAPTHLLLRTGGQTAIELLKYAAANEVSSLALMANLFRDNKMDRKLALGLAQPCVYLVGNHRMPATRTMVSAGVPAEKAVAYDWRAANPRRVLDTPVKTLGDPPYRMLYAGNMIEAKGVYDLIEAVGRLHGEGLDILLTAIGDGPDLANFKKAAAKYNHARTVIEFPGRVANSEVQRAMRDACLVCVPSRHKFPEGLPQTLTEGLLSRTPVIASDHPVFVEAFRDKEGLRFFRSAEPQHLARVIRETVHDRDAYAALSRRTADGYARVACGTLMGELIDRWTANCFPRYAVAT